MSERWKRLIAANPQWAAASSARMTRLNANPEFKARNAAAASERMKRLHADPAWAAKMREVCQGDHDPAQCQP
jgi:hypothetical protein